MFVTWSSKSRPISSAPARSISRGTARANALSFIRLRTLAGSTSASFRLGASARPRRGSRPARRRHRPGGRGGWCAGCRARRCGTARPGPPRRGSPRRSQLVGADRAVGGRIGEPLVVEVVEEPGDPPSFHRLGIAPVIGRVAAHAGLDQDPVLAQGRVLVPLVEQGECVVAGRHRSGPAAAPWPSGRPEGDRGDAERGERQQGSPTGSK